MCNFFFIFQALTVTKSEKVMRIAGEFKQILKPHYASGRITKEEYKEVMRKAVPQVIFFVQLVVMFHAVNESSVYS